MWDYVEGLGKICIYLTFVLLGHDLLNWLEYEVFSPTSLNKLWQLFYHGQYIPSLKKGSNFFDVLLNWPAFIVFGAFGGSVYVISKGRG